MEENHHNTENLKEHNAQLMEHFIKYKSNTERDKVESEIKAQELADQISSLNSIVSQHEQTIVQYECDLKKMQIDKIKAIEQEGRFRERVKALEEELIQAKKATMKNKKEVPHSANYELQTSKIIKLQLEIKDLQSKLSRSSSLVNKSASYMKETEQIIKQNDQMKAKIENMEAKLSEYESKTQSQLDKYNKLLNSYQKVCVEMKKKDDEAYQIRMQTLPSRYRNLTVTSELETPSIIANTRNSLQEYFTLASARSCISVQKQMEDLGSTLRKSVQIDNLMKKPNRCTIGKK